jgi:hypothetical protein
MRQNYGIKTFFPDKSLALVSQTFSYNSPPEKGLFALAKK